MNPHLLKALATLSLLLSAVGCSHPQPPDTRAAPPSLLSQPNPGIKITGWLVAWDSKSLASFKAHVECFEQVMPEWILCDSQGQAAERTGDASFAPEQRKEIIATARRNGVKVFGVASNIVGGTWHKEWVQRFLSSEARLKAHVLQLVQIAADAGLDGIDIDYESLDAKDRDRFSGFIKLLAEALHAKGMLLSVAAPAKASDNPSWESAKAYDYRALGEAVDVLRLMTYDFHESGSEAGPIAPNKWVEDVLKYAIERGTPKAHLAMGLACYGYDWARKPVATLTWDDWQKQNRSSETIDPASGEYINGKAYFSGARSAEAKINLAKSLQIPRIGMWRLGSEEPEFWNVACAHTAPP